MAVSVGPRAWSPADHRHLFPAILTVEFLQPHDRKTVDQSGNELPILRPDHFLFHLGLLELVELHRLEGRSVLTGEATFS